MLFRGSLPCTEKHMKLELVKEMVTALSSTPDLVASHVGEAAEEYPVGFTEVAKRIKSAAGKLSRGLHTLWFRALTARAAPQNGLWPSTGYPCRTSWLTCSRNPSPSPLGKFGKSNHCLYGTFHHWWTDQCSKKEFRPPSQEYWRTSFSA